MSGIWCVWLDLHCLGMKAKLSSAADHIPASYSNIQELFLKILNYKRLPRCRSCTYGPIGFLEIYITGLILFYILAPGYKILTNFQ